MVGRKGMPMVDGLAGTMVDELAVALAAEWAVLKESPKGRLR
jgi:hypothetical protein